jgi:ABC-2 type transport system ATP-binding protein
MAEAILEVSGLTKTYGRKRALTDVSFSLEPGKVYGLLGPNGSGKSTCLHVLTGLIGCDAGVVTIDGISLDQVSSRLHFGFAPDDLPMIGALTGREYVQLHDRLRGRHDFDRAVDLLVAFDLDRALDEQIENYSHGMKRKIQVVVAAMHYPTLLILDEPYRGLDPDAVIMLRTVIETMVGHGRSVLIATHDMDRAERECDEVMILHDGVLVAQGSPSELVRREGRERDLETAFLAITGTENDSLERRILVSSTFEQTGLNTREP